VGDITLQQVISREHPSFNVEQARLAVGRDGLVYLNSGTYLLRVRPDGSGRADTNELHYASGGVAANGEGLLGQAQGHFAHTAAILDRDFHRVAAYTELDNENFDAPQHVQAGAGGDLYFADGRAWRIVRLTPAGRVAAVYSLPKFPGNPGWITDNFRVAEAARLLAITGYAQPIRLVGFDGTTRATLPVNGVFDLDDQGNTYVLPHRGSNVLVKFAPDGKKLGEVKLALGDRLPQRDEETFTGLCLAPGGELLLKRNVPTELFERYDLATGADKGAVPSDHQRLAVALAGEIWTAGEAVGVKIDFDPGHSRESPHWHVYARPLGAPGWREMALAGGRLQVPADLAGLYQLKVTAELAPWQQGSPPEYYVGTVVEVRRPGSKGTASIATPEGRVWYGRGEAIPLDVVVRAAEADRPREVVVQLQETTDDWAPGRVLWHERVQLGPGRAAGQASPGKTGSGSATPPVAGGAQPPSVAVPVPVVTGSAELPGAVTAALVPGPYRLAAVAPELTCVAQPLLLGPGMRHQAFRRLLHGDMGLMTPCEFPAAEAADRVAATLDQFTRLGIDFLVERLGTPLQRGLFDAERFNAGNAALEKRLAADPLAVAAEKARQATPLLQSFAGYSAAGIRHMPILLMNDAGLPLGSGFDGRKPQEMLGDIERVTKALAPYPAFCGWDWACMWWHFNFGPTPEEKTAYEAAMKKAEASGAWDPIIDRVNERKLRLTSDAIALFTKKLRQIDPQGKLQTAAAGPYRKVEAYPPSDFRELGEVDLHYQCEQFASPYEAIHAADFYRRPRKPCWGHPEIYNDSGTGEQILPFACMMWMRGPDGLGVQSGLPPIFGGPVNDPRLANRGGRSVLRALNQVLARYGNWSAALATRDPVAIVASSRMFRADRWQSFTGLHFGRVVEAFLVCMANHTPASIVFTEDISERPLRNYQAVIVVDQRYEPESELVAALAEARRAGVAIFCDDTCRAEFVKGFTPLGIGFTHFDDGAGANHHDTAYKLLPERVAETLPAVHAKLAEVRPVARIDNPEVYATERRFAGSRFVFVVNDTNLPLDYGQMWRVSLFSGTRMPLVASVTLPDVPEHAAVYELMAMCRVGTGTGGDLTVPADLRTLPLRIYAVLPAPIGKVALAAREGSGGGQALKWSAAVRSAGGGQVPAVGVPIQVRLLDSGGRLLDASCGATSASGGFDGEFIVPINVTPGPLLLEAVELISGMKGTLEVAARPGQTPDGAATAAKRLPLPVQGPIEPVERGFGPHLRDVAVSPDGSLALFGAANWDENLYAIDLAAGKPAWQGRVGHWFAIAPQAAGDGFAVQGFDLNTAEGYHLYLAGRDGKPQRRFALYGLPQRLPHRFVPYLVRDRINNFAVPAGGAWVAAAGDLGLVVWDRDGKRLWGQDWWKQPQGRHTAALAALGDETLLVAEGLRVTACEARTGRALWSLSPAATGEITRAIPAADGRTVALLATTQGGRVFIVRDGKLLRALSTPEVGDAALSADGALAAVVRKNQLSLYSTSDGFLWTFGGDGTLVGPRFSPDGTRLAVGSDMGTLYVLGSSGRRLWERDLGALATLAWLPDGDLLVGGWMGGICRLDGRFRPKWTLRVAPRTADPRGQLAADEGLPTARVSGWSNAEPETLAAGEELSKLFHVHLHTGLWSTGLAQNEQLLHDGKLEAPPRPWLDWEAVEGFAEMSPVNWLQIDTGNRLLRLEGLTLYEDARHPESWLRDASFDRWDGPSARWVTVQPLLSDAPLHSHRFPQAVEGTRFRILLPWGCVGNVRLGEIRLHGQDLGPSHPDVRAKRPVAIVFDENLTDISEQFQTGFCPGFHPKSGPEAYSGANYFVVEPWRSEGESVASPLEQVTHWHFTIAENPQPGQYRWVQFAAKALSPATRRITLRPDHPDLTPAAKFEHPDAKWRTYRVDLWTLWGKPRQPRVVTQFHFGVEGGAAAFDQVVLGRSAADLDTVKPLPSAR
jgi:outer membrane protein assembly factor BamB